MCYLQLRLVAKSLSQQTELGLPVELVATSVLIGVNLVVSSICPYKTPLF